MASMVWWITITSFRAQVVCYSRNLVVDAARRAFIRIKLPPQISRYMYLHAVFPYCTSSYVMTDSVFMLEFIWEIFAEWCRP
jgi:hypothetical protein